MWLCMSPRVFFGKSYFAKLVRYPVFLHKIDYVMKYIEGSKLH